MPVIARSLGVDPRYLLRLALMEYQPEVWDVFATTMGPDATMTQDEVALIQLARSAGKGRTPNLQVTENRSALTTTIQLAVERDDKRDAEAVARLEATPKNLR